MNRIYFLAPDEDWIVDTFKRQWDSDNGDISTQTPDEADVLWACADWCWQRLTPWLGKKKLLITCHHYVPGKFNEQEFKQRDQFVAAYHVPNEHTEAFIKPFTTKPIHVIPYWADQRMWKPTGTKGDLRTKHGLPLDKYVIGSFQRDTEGDGIPKGLFYPKLEKGPDLFADYVERVANDVNTHVLLAGWRRQYLIERFKASGVPFTYIEMPSQETLNELYQCLDLYAVTSRYEGGPQSLIECGLLDVPVVSTPVGMAAQVFKPPFGGRPISIAEDVYHARPTVPYVDDLKLPQGYEPYRKLLESL